VEKPLVFMKNKFYNRKTKEVVFLANFFLTLFVANFALAQVNIDNPLKYNSIEEIIENVTDFIFSIGVVLIPLMIIIGGFFIVTSAGDSGKLEKGKKIIIWTIIGTIFVVFSKGLYYIVKSVIGVK